MVDERPEEPTEGESDSHQTGAVDNAPVAEGDDEGLVATEGDAAVPTGEDAGVTELAAELEAAKDAALRAQADAMNVQRRAEQEIEKAKICAGALLWRSVERGRQPRTRLGLERR